MDIRRRVAVLVTVVAILLGLTSAPTGATVPGDTAPAVTTSAAGWHHLWGPAGVWTNRNGGWFSNSFHSRSSTLGVNYRCWWWRGQDSMWAYITDGSGWIVARSGNVQCDGRWKTLIYRHNKYHMGVQVNPRGRTVVEVKAYDYW